MKTSEALRIWIGDLKPDKEVKSWMDRLDRMEERYDKLVKNGTEYFYELEGEIDKYETEYWEAQQHIDMLYRCKCTVMTEEEYADYLSNLDAEERRENET